MPNKLTGGADNRWHGRNRLQTATMATVTELAIRHHHHMANLTGTKRVTREEAPLEHNACANPNPHTDRDQVATRSSFAKGVLGKGREVYHIPQIDWQAVARLQ